MKRSLFLKIFAGFFFIILVLTAYILFVSFRAIENHTIATVSRELENVAQTLLVATQQAMPHAMAPTSRAEGAGAGILDRVVEDAGKRTGRRITLIAVDGTVVADSENDPSAMANHRDRPEVQEALEGRVGTALRYSRTQTEEMLYVAVPVFEGDGGGRILGIVRVSAFVRDLKSVLSAIRSRIFVVSSIMAILSLGGAMLFSTTIMNPIRQLIEASRRVARGDFNARVFLRHEDELKVLADTYNFMTEKIEGYISELSAQREELRTIISSMQPGLLVLDKWGRITLCNGSARRLFGGGELDGKAYWEVIDAPEIFALIRDVQSKKGGAGIEIATNGSWYQVSAAYIEAIDETLVLMNDITELKNLERIKRDFVMNVSHELRTPLTAIKGYADTIEGVGGENGKYLDVIKRHTERLINVVHDLLLLSEMEEKGASRVREEVRLEETASQVLRLFEERIAEKGLESELRFPEGLPPLTGDSLKLEQLLINLVDNAVKYTERGKILIMLGRREEELELVVQDTGIGIPEQHQSRVFERFYTVDKSHSRRMGGTGLGLSIVKHIALLHGGSIGMKSTPGEGTAFIIRFPLPRDRAEAGGT